MTRLTTTATVNPNTSNISPSILNVYTLIFDGVWRRTKLTLKKFCPYVELVTKKSQKTSRKGLYKIEEKNAIQGEILLVLGFTVAVVVDLVTISSRKTQVPQRPESHSLGI